MKNCVKVLGKVSISVEGDWDINKPYARLCIVKNRDGGGTYLSKIDVPAGIEIDNEDYWQFLCGEGSINNLVSFDIQIVDSLPAVGVKGVMYLVKDVAENQNLYSEYIWIADANTYEKIGSFNSEVFTRFKNEITEEVDDIKSEVDKFTEDISDELDSFKTEVNQSISTFQSTTNKSISDFKTEVNQANNTFKQQLTEDNEAFKTEINNNIVEIAKDYLEANIKFSAVGSAGTKIGTMKIGDVNTDIYVPIKKCTIDDYSNNVKEDVVYFIVNG